MKVLRFMSAHEAIRLIRGETLQNTTDHRALGSRTTSIGFCFALADGDPAVAMHEAAKYLSGITDMEACLFGTLKSSFDKTDGLYSIGRRDELCTTHYSLEDFKDWELYAHSFIPPTMLRLIASPHWEQPVLVTSSKEVTRVA